jgi:hypothetical protein
MTNDQLAWSLNLGVEYWLDWGREFPKTGPFETYEEAMAEGAKLNRDSYLRHFSFSIEKRYRTHK